MDRESPTRDEQPLAEAPWRASAGGGLVRVREYACTACVGDPPADEQFAGASIAIVRSGVFGIRTGQRTQILSTGFLLLGNAGQNYEASHEHGVGDRCLVFDFRGRALEDLAESLRKGAGAHPFAENVLPPHPRVDAWRQLAQEELIGGRAGSGMGLDELGLSLAACVLGLRGAGTPRSPSAPIDRRRAREPIVAAIARIEQSSVDELPLADLAAFAGLSPFHFLRRFQGETGVTPHRFLVQTRIRRAIELLRETSRPITDIAFDVGFGDLSNFIHAFRREVGVSPRHYRRWGLSERRDGT